jgi:hypothetical protein
MAELDRLTIINQFGRRQNWEFPEGDVGVFRNIRLFSGLVYINLLNYLIADPQGCSKPHESSIPCDDVPTDAAVPWSYELVTQTIIVVTRKMSH